MRSSAKICWSFGKKHSHPWHSPPHWAGAQSRWLISAACFEHRQIIGGQLERMDMFCEQLLQALDSVCFHVAAWCVLPNHYHALIHTHALKKLLKAIGKLHGRTAYSWNGEEDQRGRKVWFNCVETAIKSERHYWVTMNYVHHNPVRHGYVREWQNWPFSSAAEYLQRVGRAEATRIWNSYPILDYGADWDAPEL